MQSEARLEQHEFAITRDQEVDHLVIAVALLQALAHQNAQILRQRRVGIIDRLVLTDHAAQFFRQRARARLEHRVVQNFVRLHGPG